MPKVSVIVPIYNVGEYLQGCLESVAAQTLQDFECICVDDGSTDTSGQIADEFAAQHSKNFSVIHKKNGGLSSARNAGLRQATGEYVFFLDSDDYIHPLTLETMVNIAQKEDVKVVNCNAQNTAKMYKKPLQNIDLNDCKVSVTLNPLKAFLTRRDIKTGVCFRLYKRDIIGKDPFIEGIHFEDVPFTTCLLNRLDKMALINAAFYYYYKNPNSVMRSNFSIDKIDSYDKIIRFLNAYFEREAPEKIPMLKQYLFNQRVKMMLNQCIRKQKDKAKQEDLFAHAVNVTRNLYKDGLISFAGLKLKHKITLWLLLNRPSYRPALLWARAFK